jgi:hypothetical protein
MEATTTIHGIGNIASNVESLSIQHQPYRHYLLII